MTFQAKLDTCKTVFAVDMSEKFENVSGVVFAAPRPLLGAEVDLGVCLHGRFHVSVDATDYAAEAFLTKNIELDARVVLAATRHELLELVLQNNKHADRYRELPLDEQFDVLSHKINALRDMPYSDAITRLERVRSNMVTH